MVPARDAAAPLAGPSGARACRLRDRARLRLHHRLSRDPDPLADASRGSPRGGRPARRRAARPRLGDLPPRRAAGSRRVSRRSTKSARICAEGLAALAPGRGGANRRAQAVRAQQSAVGRPRGHGPTRRPGSPERGRARPASGAPPATGRARARAARRCARAPARRSLARTARGNRCHRSRCCHPARSRPRCRRRAGSALVDLMFL